MTRATPPNRQDPEPGASREPVALGLLAAIAIAVIWGGILVIAQIELALTPELRWWGHAFVHVWMGAWAGVVAVTAIGAVRSGRAAGRLLRTAVVTAALLAAIAAVANLLEVPGAYPALREFHDAVNRVGAPVGWLLLANLAVIVLLGRPRRAASG